MHLGTHMRQSREVSTSDQNCPAVSWKTVGKLLFPSNRPWQRRANSWLVGTLSPTFRLPRLSADFSPCRFSDPKPPMLCTDPPPGAPICNGLVHLAWDVTRRLRLQLYESHPVPAECHGHSLCERDVHWDRAARRARLAVNCKRRRARERPQGGNSNNHCSRVSASVMVSCRMYRAIRDHDDHGSISVLCRKDLRARRLRHD